MQNKKDLAKIAITALVLATTSPIAMQASNLADGTFLAAGCPQHGCPQSRANKDGTRSSGDNEKNQESAPNLTNNTHLTEEQLLKDLSPEGRGMYLNLSPEGKALALHLASQEYYRNKNLAVQDAHRRMNGSRNQPNPQ